MKLRTFFIVFTFASLLIAADNENYIFQNPLTGKLRIPVSNQSIFGSGENGKGYSNLTEIKPVIPLRLGEASLINRVIIGYIYESENVSGEGTFLGLEPLSWTVFFSPSADNPLSWGLGPSFLIPIGSENQSGSAGIGGFFIAVVKRWTIGLLLNNVWSMSDRAGINDVNELTLQYYLTYDVAENWFLRSVSTLQADWEAASGDQWTIPLGLGLGWETEVQGVDLGISVQGFGFASKPEGEPDWKIEFEVEVKVPK